MVGILKTGGADMDALAVKETTGLRYCLGIIVLPLFFYITGCADSVPHTTEPSGKPMQRITVLTYNTLHGLETSGWTVKPGESKEVHDARLDLQFEQLSQVQPDLILLQEVNPLPAIAGSGISPRSKPSVCTTAKSTRWMPAAFVSRRA